jgi:hypothetical protein
LRKRLPLLNHIGFAGDRRSDSLVQMQIVANRDRVIRAPFEKTLARFSGT